MTKNTIGSSISNMVYVLAAIVLTILATGLFGAVFFKFIEENFHFDFWSSFFCTVIVASPFTSLALPIYRYLQGLSFNKE